MYGTWAGWSFAGVLFLVLLGLILLITPWGVFIAVLIALLAAVGFAVGMSTSRQQTREAGESPQGEHGSATEGATEARQPSNPRSGGDPVSGEG